MGGANNDGVIFRFASVPAVTLTTHALTFGNQARAQTSAAKTVTLRNSGTGLLNVSDVAIEGSGFAISANTCAGARLAKTKTCSVSVTFTPAVLGNLTGTLSFTDNASTSPQVLALTGTGAQPATLGPATNFGRWAVGTPSPARTFTLSNNQSGALTRIVISKTGDFAVSATTCATAWPPKASARST